MHLCHTLFFTLRDDQPICVPDFPAWVCDMCGQRVYDPFALAELQVLFEKNRYSRQKLHKSWTDADKDQPLTVADP